MPEKVTKMVLKMVDLQCPCCYKKIKKLLCKFPQIRDRVFDEKNNTVTIIVVCCSPEKIRDKLCCKGGKSIKSIEIIEPTKPKPPVVVPLPPPKAPEPAPETPEPAPKPAPKAPEPAPPAPEPTPHIFIPSTLAYPSGYPVDTCCGPCYSGQPGGPCYETYGRQIDVCCSTCYAGQPGGPCYQGYKGYGRPIPSSYDSYGYARPVPSSYYDSNGFYRLPRGCCVNQCDEYLSDDSPNGCTIM